MYRTRKLLVSTMIAAAGAVTALALSATASAEPAPPAPPVNPGAQLLSQLSTVGRRAAVDTEPRVGHVRHRHPGSCSGHACPRRHGVADPAARCPRFRPPAPAAPAAAPVAGPAAAPGNAISSLASALPAPLSNAAGLAQLLPSGISLPGLTAPAATAPAAAATAPIAAPHLWHLLRLRHLSRHPPLRRLRRAPAAAGRLPAGGAQRPAVTPEDSHTPSSLGRTMSPNRKLFANAAVAVGSSAALLLGMTGTANAEPARRCRSMPCRHRACRRWRASARRFKRRPPIPTTRRRC